MSKLPTVLLFLCAACGAPENGDDMREGQKIGEDGFSGGWAQTGELITGNIDKTVSMQAKFPVSKYYTILFGILQQRSFPFDAVADITWTTEGNQVTRQVSVGNGVTISGTAMAVKVIVRDRTNPTIYAADIGNIYSASILCTPGTRPTVERPPTLIAEDAVGNSIFLVAPQNVVTIPIPQNAGVISVSVTASSAPGAPAIITETDAFVTIGNSIAGLKVYAPGDGDFVPVPPNATEIVLLNNFPLLGPDIQFTVTFGIDG